MDIRNIQRIKKSISRLEIVSIPDSFFEKKNLIPDDTQF